jgi:cell pole-organizing protein PopZ
MEEILSSIRRIISEDGQRDRGDAPAATPASEPAAPETVQDVAVEEEVLELTDEVVEEAPALESEPIEELEPEPIEEIEEEPLTLTEAPMPPETVASPAAPYVPPAATPRVASGRLISEPAELASAAALSILGQLVNPDRQLNAEGREMIEAAIRDKIEPLLRDWLDGNLPQLVERLVREEIQRVMDRALNRNS